MLKVGIIQNSSSRTKSNLFYNRDYQVQIHLQNPDQLIIQSSSATELAISRNKQQSAESAKNSFTSGVFFNNSNDSVTVVNLLRGL